MAKDPEIVNLFDQNGNLTPEAMERYLSGKLSEKESAAVEQHLAGSPFDREALEGLKKLHKGSLRNDLEELDARVLARARGKAVPPLLRSYRLHYWAAAAGLAALIGLTVIIVYTFKEPPDHQLAVNGQDSKIENPEPGTRNPEQPATGSPFTPAADSAGMEIGGIAMAQEQPRKQPVQPEPAAPVKAPDPVRAVQVVADEAVLEAEYDVEAEGLEVEDQVPLTEQQAAIEKPAEVSEESVILVQEVRAPAYKRTGASKKAMEMQYQAEADMAGLPREDTTAAESQIFVVVESMPEFPGGEDAFNKYLADSLLYPQTAREQKIQGRVFVTFIVEKDGSVSDARILRGIGGGCDEEALRVIQNMPKWIPGKQRGKPVRVQYNLPIMFKLEKN